MHKAAPILLLFIFFFQRGRHVCAQKVGLDSVSIQNLPSIPFLPDPLLLNEGSNNIPIVNTTQWNRQKNRIKEQYQLWISGSVPPAPNVKATVLYEKVEDGITLRMVELRFGREDKAKMTVELMIPPAAKPLPVFLTQWNHRGWAQVAVRRGYIGCVFAGADSKDDTENYNEVFPGYDFATLMKRAWGASRVVDYLHKLPEVDTAAIAITGHSRNAKQALMAAAFDNRIKAVVSSSGGTGGENTFRYSDNRFTPGSFDRMIANKPDWFVHRLPWFIGREHKLPVDQNSLMSLIAPRGLMMVSAITEDEGNPWGIGEAYKSVKKVYKFLQADSNIAILLRNGRHQHAARDAESFVDFFDYIFGRSKNAPENKLHYNYSFNSWKQLSGENINPGDFEENHQSLSNQILENGGLANYQDSTRQKIKWLLGEEPPGVHATVKVSPRLNNNSTYPADYLDEVIGEPVLPASIKKMTVGPYTGLGDNLWSNLYIPATAVEGDSVIGKLPLVIYLHAYAYSTGYHRKDVPAIRKICEKGFAVLAFDMMGFGSRIEEAKFFYNRYPKWSVMGKLVTDTRSVIRDAYTRMIFIDTSNIYLVGYSLGGSVALLTSALDNRVKGTAVLSAFSSLRKDNKETEGIRHYAQLHGLIPKLGFFVGHEKYIPVDFEDIIACIAPRPLFVIAPKRDRAHTIASVRETISAVLPVYTSLKNSDKLTLKQPDMHSEFKPALQEEVADWLLNQYTNKTK